MIAGNSLKSNSLLNGIAKRASYVRSPAIGQSIEFLSLLFRQIMRVIKSTFFAVATLLLAVSAAYSQDLSSLGTPLAMPEGNQTSIAELGKGKVIIVSFWATWCTPCKEEMKAMHTVYDELKANGVEYVAVSVDNTKTMARVGPYITSKGYTFPILLDPNKEIFEVVNGTDVPYTLVYDMQGKLRFKHDGYLEGDIDNLKEEVLALAAEGQSTGG